MPRNLLVGSKVATFTPDDGKPAIDLHTFMSSVNDKVKPRLAMHEYLKRDGGEVEFMGNSPNEYRFALAFVGPTWAKQYRDLAARVNAQPKGILIHPVFGRQRVACQGIETAGIDVTSGVNSVSVPISFVTDEVDTQLTGELATSVNVKASDITDAVSAFASAAAVFATAATQVALVGTTAAAYASAAADASNTNIPDPSIDTKLSACEAATVSAIAAIEADPANVRAADAFDACSGAEQVYAQCLALAGAFAAAHPVVIDWTVKADTGLIAMCSALYGTAADAYIDQVLTLNRIANPALIPAGVVLRLPTPTNV